MLVCVHRVSAFLLFRADVCHGRFGKCLPVTEQQQWRRSWVKMWNTSFVPYTLSLCSYTNSNTILTSSLPFPYFCIILFVCVMLLLSLLLHRFSHPWSRSSLGESSLLFMNMTIIRPLFFSWPLEKSLVFGTWVKAECYPVYQTTSGVDQLRSTLIIPSPNVNSCSCVNAKLISTPSKSNAKSRVAVQLA